MMTERQKQAIYTMRQEGQSYLVIADTLALSPNTIKSFCRRSGCKPEGVRARDSSLCRNCGKLLVQTPGGRKKTFCSDRCRYIWWNQKRGKKPYRLICCQCGKEFISYGNRKRKFCSRECYLQSRYGEEDGVP